MSFKDKKKIYIFEWYEKEKRFFSSSWNKKKKSKTEHKQVQKQEGTMSGPQTMAAKNEISVSGPVSSQMDDIFTLKAQL